MTQMRWSGFIGLAAGVGMIAIVLTGTSAGPAIAQTFKPMMSFIINDANSPVPVRTVGSNVAHVGRPVSDIVQLTWDSSDSCFVRQLPGGVLESNCYIPPSGRTLVVTDVQWRAHSGLSSPGVYAGIVFVSPSGTIAYLAQALTDADGFASGSHSLQTGFVFHPDLTVQPSMSVVSLHGYVVPSE
jgi:hypothetical protein